MMLSSRRKPGSTPGQAVARLVAFLDTGLRRYDKREGAAFCRIALFGHAGLARCMAGTGVREFRG